MEIKSVFREGETVPERYTCDGRNINPPLDFSGIPKGTKSLALIIDDPDSPSGVFTHWIVWNIPLDNKAIKENSVPRGSVQGLNDFGQAGYGGPCPHQGIHRYRFRVFALDVLLAVPTNPVKDYISKAMDGHVLDSAVLTGVYGREGMGENNRKRRGR